MAKFDPNTITLEGRQLLAHLWTHSLPLQVKSLALGDGERPPTPEGQKALVHERARVPVSSKRDLGEGVVAVRGVFKPNEILEGFYFHEIGLIAQGIDGASEILFCYGHAEKADYISPAEATSITDEVITLCLVTGSAPVLIQGLDPNAVLTVRDVEEMFADLDIDKIQAEIASAKKEIEDLARELEQASGGFVKKEGNSLINGVLTATRFTGPLSGSATQWSEWRLFSSLEELNAHTGAALLETSSMEAIIRTMPVRSELIWVSYTQSPYLPNLGVSEIKRLSENEAMAKFYDSDGRNYAGSYSRGVWRRWRCNDGVPVGSVIAFDGSTPPSDYLILHGQFVSMAEYPDLYAVIGGRYGISGTFFRLQDTRGLFMRGLDEGRGIDTGRKLGFYQEDAAPNITGCFGSSANRYGFDYSVLSGAFLVGASGRENSVGSSGRQYYADLFMDASRSHRAYGAALEVRPKNVAVNYIIKAR